MRLSFYGACRDVTGSNFLIETDGAKILLECGLFQGSREAWGRNFQDFAYEVKSLDCVIVCHAHLDHTGRLPKLVKRGFTGPVFSTEPTKALAALVLEDNAKLMREEAQRDNHPPLYDLADISKLMTLFKSTDYGHKVEVAKNVYLIFKNAGHILGSATALIETGDQKLVYTSDLGNTPSHLLEPPEFVDEADLVICESTYGGRVHEAIERRKEKLAEIIRSIVAKNGILIIPAFALERTQELLHDIEDFCTIEGCEKPTFYLDSPLAEKITSVFAKYPQFLAASLREEHQGLDFFGLSRLKITSSAFESKQIRDRPNPKVIIAGSGMMNGGRILYHARDFLGDENNALLFVGYQTSGTLGRRILDGKRKLKILGKRVTVGAQVLAIGSYSAHADSLQIIDWLKRIKRLKRIFLVHGEGDQSLALSKNIERHLNITSTIPSIGESYEV